MNTKLNGKYVLARVDTVSVSGGTLAGGTISSTVSVAFEKVANDAVCIPICVDSGWSICTKCWIDGNTLYAQFGSWAGTHSIGGRFNVLQFVKV